MTKLALVVSTIFFAIALAAAALPSECSPSGSNAVTCQCFNDIPSACQDLIAQHDLVNLKIDCCLGAFTECSTVILTDDHALQLGMCLTRLPIQTLSLSTSGQTDISAPGLLSLASNISQMKASSISIDFTGMDFGDAGAASIADGFMKSTAIDWNLKLGSNDIGDTGAVSLGGVLGKIQAKTLNLDLGLNSGINETGLRSLGRGLGRSTTVTDLALGMDSLSLGGKGMEAFWDGVRLLGGVRALQISVVDSNVDGPSLCALGEGIGHLSTLESLSMDLNSIEFTVSGMDCLGKGVGKLPKLKSITVDFVNNGFINDQGLAAYVRGMSGARQLSHVDLKLGGSDLGDDGAIALGKSVSQLSDLVSLYVDLSKAEPDGKVTDQGILGLSSAIQTASSLNDLYLNIDKHKVGDVGLQALGKTFSTLEQLASIAIRLSGTTVGDAGVTAFGKQLGAKPPAKLRFVFADFSADNITSLGIKGFAEGLACLDLKSMKPIAAELGGAWRGEPAAWIFTDASGTCLENPYTGVKYHCNQFNAVLV